eukprot:gene1922-1164_t
MGPPSFKRSRDGFEGGSRGRGRGGGAASTRKFSSFGAAAAAAPTRGGSSAAPSPSSSSSSAPTSFGAGGGGGGRGGRFDRSASARSTSSFPGPHRRLEQQRGTSSSAMQDAYRPQVIPGDTQQQQRRATPSSSSTSTSTASPSAQPAPSHGPVIRHSVVVILEHCGLHLGRSGGHLVDAYDRATTTALHNPGLMWARPDIVHQCLLALFDSDLAYRHLLKVYMHLVPSGKVVEVSPALRPPRTFARFKGLMASLLRDGQVLARPNNNTAGGAPPGRAGPPSSTSSSSAAAASGGALLRILPGSIAPILPYGAPCVGLCNDVGQRVRTTTTEATEAVANPVSDEEFQGGLKRIFGFYCISCSEEGITARPEHSKRQQILRQQNDRRRHRRGGKGGDDDEDDDEEEVEKLSEEEEDEFVSAPTSTAMMRTVDYVTRTIAPSAYPLPAHVLCARLCEGFGHVLRISA